MVSSLFLVFSSGCIVQRSGFMVASVRRRAAVVQDFSLKVHRSFCAVACGERNWVVRVVRWPGLGIRY